MTLPRLAPAVSALLRHYRASLVATRSSNPRVHALIVAAGLSSKSSEERTGLGLVDRSAHRLFSGLSVRERRAWRSAWQAHGLLGLSGRETFRGCLVAPLLVWDEARPALVGLPLRALLDPRGVSLRGRTDRFALFVPGPITRASTLICCSDPFDAALLRCRGEEAIAAFGGYTTPAQLSFLAMALRKRGPRHLRIVCAATMQGRVARDAWLAVALAAGLRADVVELPPGCGVRDLRSVAGDAAIADLLKGRHATPNAPRRDSPHAPSQTPVALPWAPSRSALARDLSAYTDHVAACGHGRSECRRRALALALFWHACASAGVVAMDQLTAAGVEIERALAMTTQRGRAGLRDRAMLEVLYSSGVRRGELVGLDVVDLDMSRRVLRVRRGKGGSTRLVPLGQRAVAWVQRYVESERPRQLRDASEPALFLSRQGRRLGAKIVTARMHACLRAAGITKPGSCHIIRHSVATLMHDAGADIRDLQALLGHALLTSTQLYTRVSMARLLEVHARTHPAEREVMT